jgi:hypothetical protein
MILSHRHDNGSDLWATPDRNLCKGAPFSTLESVLYLLELGVSHTDPLIKDVAELIFGTQREDGRFKIATGAIYPCQTAHAANVLCHMGYAEDERLKVTFEHLLDTQYQDGGWRCNSFKYGRGPETEYSNPFPTLIALDAFRHTDLPGQAGQLNRAIDFLLEHWTIRKPIGPCHYGIGSLFMQAEYPFRTYNIFMYVYVLSFYGQAREDKRFREVFEVLQSKLLDGQMVVERVAPKLAKLSFCEKAKPSIHATKRYEEILENIGG